MKCLCSDSSAVSFPASKIFLHLITLAAAQHTTPQHSGEQGTKPQRRTEHHNTALGNTAHHNTVQYTTTQHRASQRSTTQQGVTTLAQHNTQHLALSPGSRVDTATKCSPGGRETVRHAHDAAHAHAFTSSPILDAPRPARSPDGHLGRGAGRDGDRGSWGDTHPGAPRHHAGPPGNTGAGRRNPHCLPAAPPAGNTRAPSFLLPHLGHTDAGRRCGTGTRVGHREPGHTGACRGGDWGPQGAEPGDSSSSRKTQVTSLPGSSSGPPPPLPPRPPSRSPDHSAAIKDSSGSPVTPLTPHTPSPTGSPPPNWANGRLGTSTGNPGHSAHPLPPALPPPSPIDTSQTDRAQLARIWSAGEDDQWAGGGRRGGLRQRPPWAWTKGRRRRRKLPGEPAPPLPDLPPVPVPRRAPAQTPSLPGRVESSSHDSIGGGSDARVPTSAVQAAPQLDGGDGAGRYEVLRPGGGHIDFKVTETGEFDGFSVTRTEEVDDAPPDTHQANTSWAGVTRGEAASDRHDSPSDGGIAASGREKLPGESDRSPEGTPLPEDRTNDAPGEISLSTTSSQGEDDRAAPSSPLPTLEDIYSRELSQMKQEVQAPQYGLARPRAEAAGAEATTLPSLYNGDLIPPLPDHWGRPWSGVGRLGDFSGAVNTPAPAPEVNQPLATFPAQVQTEVPGEGTPWNVKGSTGHPATAPPLPQAAAPHTSREDENDGAWQARHLTEHNVSTAGTAATPGPVPPPPSGPQHEARRAADMKHGGGAATHNSQATQPSPRGREGAGASWPGAGERVEFVTVVPGGNWDVWGGPAIWDSISSTSNHSLRGSPVYSVYWGDTGGPGSPAGWPEGVWVIRGGSLAAIMALVATISVQVARDGPARRASVAEGPTRVLHGQHATLATNLATSLASAHVLLIFGIQVRPPSSLTIPHTPYLIHKQCDPAGCVTSESIGH
ncbi:hypothetical protein O3P69_005997 [Scylla paramamosain]|uniref:Uncharacterized protein n=1 Tax=Scylla paramamosain TaxID=85552 RepID=A0AAW0U585_SCYPA